MGKHYPIFLAVIIFFSIISCNQKTSNKTTIPSKPKLIVGIVVDQMRWDFLYRYSEKYSEHGFKRLLREGFSCENAYINYSPSYTGPGHACIYTGSVPSVHGITGNQWYDYKENRLVYCADDTTENTIGSDSQTGRKSPRRMLTTTITDELRLATNFQSKVIGIALKDRSSIIPAGHTANAAYFFDGSAGKWISSSYYMNELPAWVNQFNEQKISEKYLSGEWTTLLTASEYSESTEDNVPWEKPYSNETIPAFGHKVNDLAKSNFDVIAATPFGNTLTIDFAEAAITSENLGKDDTPDFLTLSLSSPDLIGHQFGPNSVEVEDCYLRLDEEIKKFLEFLDKNVGAGNYLVFLTADHGAAHNPDFLKEKNIPAGVFPTDSIRGLLDIALQKKYGAGKWVLDFQNMQFYLNNNLIAARKIDREGLKKMIKNFMLQYDGIANVLDLENLPAENAEATMKEFIGNGVYENRSGQLFVLYKPGWIDRFSKGTMHGTIYPYDTHIPLVWMGWKVEHSEDFSKVYMTDIAPTIAAMLHIEEPSGCVGKPITSVMESIGNSYPHAHVKSCN